MNRKLGIQVLKNIFISDAVVEPIAEAHHTNFKFNTKETCPNYICLVE